MGDARIVYGLAYGKQGNWYSLWQNRTHGVLAQANTAPDVTTGYLFYTVNSAATTIRDFSLSAPGNPGGNVAPLFEGKVIRIFFTDSNTTVGGPRVFLADSNNTFTQNSILELIYHNSAWYEMDRTMGAGGGTTRAYSLAGTNNAITIDQATQVAVITGTGALYVISGISGGYVGQILSLYGNSGGTTVNVTTDGNIMLANTSAFAIKSSGTHAIATFVKVTDGFASGKWMVGNGGW